jgi:hypothetical protein
MRSRTTRLSFGFLAMIALAGAGWFVVSSERRLASLRGDGRTFDLHAREVTAALSDLRAAQQAYVAAGQGVAFWMPKVAQIADAVGTSIAALRTAAIGTDAQSALDQAAATLIGFAEADRTARNYLTSGQPLMAGDVIFNEGDVTAAAAARHVESARLAEHQTLDAAEAVVRKQEAAALAAAGGITAVVLLVLGLARPVSTVAEAPASLSIAPSLSDASKSRFSDSGREDRPGDSVASIRAVSPVLKTAAQLCTDFACMRDLNDLQLLLARASDVMDAAGVVVWLGNAEHGDLEPVLSHGYSEDTRARLPNVPRNANNAAAAAYRSGEVQIVLSRPGGAKGAVVAPIRGVQGCIGALSAEIRGGGEASESVQALASIVAAQLGSVLAAAQPDVTVDRIAASS